MQCVETVKYTLLLNGQKACSFTSQRGLCQGDPLSPYLFLCCMNVPSSILHKEEMERSIQGIQFNRSGPTISHVMYADDLILFFKADHDSCLRMSNILQSFCDASGLAIHIDKSFIVFSPNTHRDLKDEMASLFNLKWENKLGKYLGTFVDDQKDQGTNFQMLIDKMNSTLAGWKGRLLSQAGRLTLIRATLASDMMYPMSSTQFTLQQNTEINMLVNNFFWGDFQQAKRTPHLLQARILKLPKKLGGIGIRYAHITNKVLLA